MRARASGGGLAAIVLLGVIGGCGPRHALGGGVGAVRVEVGGEEEVSFTPLLAARVGIPSSGGGLFWAADVQPLPARNPARDESVSTLFLMPSLQLPVGRAVRLRGGVGPSFHLWTGNDPAESTSLGLTVGGSAELALGPESPWAVEAMARFVTGVEVGGQLFGLQVLRYLR